jgi:hypothetical protein
MSWLKKSVKAWLLGIVALVFAGALAGLAIVERPSSGPHFQNGVVQGVSGNGEEACITPVVKGGQQICGPLLLDKYVPVKGGETVRFTTLKVDYSSSSLFLVIEPTSKQLASDIGLPIR